MEKKDNQNKYRVTQCIADRFAVMAKTDVPEMDDKNVENFAHNCALALDMIGAGKIKEGESYDLMLRCINNEFKDEEELLNYINAIRAPRKPKQYTVETENKRKIKKLLASGVPMTNATIAQLLNCDENFVNEVIKDPVSK